MTTMDHVDVILEQVKRESIEPACQSCKFYQVVEAYKGECRKNPPVLIVNRSNQPGAEPVTRFPIVRTTNWCGAFEPR